MNTIKLSIVTPMGIIFDDEIKSVTFPGKDGEFGVLSGHCNLLSLLQVGVIEVEMENSTEAIAINWSYVNIANNNIDVLVDEAIAIRGKDNESHKIADKIEHAKQLVNSVSSPNVSIASIESKISSFA
jgi:F-type H+-transporting ATPase subunit epsilon